MRALCLLLVLAAQAPVAGPGAPGTPAGEPAADLAGLRVARETLTLDLRPLGARPLVGDRIAGAAPGGVATVEAEYRVVNAGPTVVVPLQFVAPGPRVEAARVWLDGRPVPALPVDSVRVPPSWTFMAETPGLGTAPLPYRVDASRARGLTFVVAVPTGQHTVRVRYGVRPGAYDDGSHPNRVWQVAYGLAPARRWAGLGQLDVAVLAPEGWDVAASLPLRPGPDGPHQLAGRFAGVPGDVLAVSVRAPAPALRVPLWVAGGLVALVIVGFAGFVAGRLVAQSDRRWWAAAPASVLAGIVAAVALTVLVGIGGDLGDSDAYGYGLVVRMMTVVGPLALVVGAALTLAVAAWTARRRRST